MGFLSDYGDNLKIYHYTEPSVMRNTHVHHQYELYFCPDDIEQKSVVNGVEYSYKYPCVILSTPYTVHSMSCNSDAEGYDRYVFYFGNKTISSFDQYHLPKWIFEKNTGLLFVLTVDEADELRRIAELYSKNSPVAENELIFALFVNRLLALCGEERITKIGTSSFYIQDVLQYVSENYGCNINSENIAKKFAVSRSKLDRDFRQFIGITVHGYIETCRINQAKFLLQYNGELSVGEIAELCGFGNESHFFPFFKKHEGVTPAEYRRNTQKQPRKAVK